MYYSTYLIERNGTMLIPIYYLKDGKTRLRSVIQSINQELHQQQVLGLEPNEKAVQAIYSKYHEITLDMLLATQEIIATLTYQSLASTVSVARDIGRAIRNCDPYKKEYTLEEFRQGVIDILHAFKEEEDNYFSSHITSTFLSRNFLSLSISSSTNKYDDLILRDLAKKIVPQNYAIKVLDSSGVAPYDTIALFDGIQSEEKKLYAFSIQHDHQRHYTGLKDHFERLALGRLSGGSFSNEVFDMMFSSPTLSLNSASDRILAKSEVNEIKETARYIRPDGVFVLVIPKFRLYKDMASAIGTHYKNLRAYRFDGMGDENQLIYLIGQKKTKQEIAEKSLDSYIYLRELIKAPMIPSSDECDAIYELPQGETIIKQFRGSVLNEEEIEEMFASSNAYDQFLASQNSYLTPPRMQEPLVPFTTGQIGLVLTSGKLDGVIDEKNGAYHIVKGRVVKEKQLIRDRDPEKNEVTYTETTTNRVEINVIAANGEMKKLA